MLRIKLWLWRWVERKAIHTRVIHRTSDGQPYLMRYTLFRVMHHRTKQELFGIKVHRILQSDDLCMHDHPWGFWSFILKGGYHEHTPADFAGPEWYGPGSWIRRRARHIHRLELPKDKDGRDIPAWSLVFTFRVIRPWGFWTRTQGFIPWPSYNGPDHCADASEGLALFPDLQKPEEQYIFNPAKHGFTFDGKRWVNKTDPDFIFYQHTLTKNWTLLLKDQVIWRGEYRNDERAQHHLVSINSGRFYTDKADFHIGKTPPKQ